MQNIEFIFIDDNSVIHNTYTQIECAHFGKFILIDTLKTNHKC